MPTLNTSVLALVAGALIVTSGCGSNAALPTEGARSAAAAGGGYLVPGDTTSILKKLTKDVEIGSTVDPKNGDMGPRAISVAPSTFGLKKGQLLVCNFDDASGNAGKGTTIEVLDPKPHSKPRTFTENSKVEGCDGDAVTAGNQVYGGGLTSGVAAQFNQVGKLAQTYGPPIESPLADADAFCGFPYAPEDVYVSDAKTGAITKLEFLEVSRSGKAKVTQVIAGFDVNKGSGWSVLGPSGIQYNATRTGSTCNDTVYVVDGVDNTVVAVSNASSLLTKNEIVVEPGGKKFKCSAPKSMQRRPCAALVFSVSAAQDFAGRRGLFFVTKIDKSGG